MNKSKTRNSNRFSALRWDDQNNDCADSKDMGTASEVEKGTHWLPNGASVLAEKYEAGDMTERDVLREHALSLGGGCGLVGGSMMVLTDIDPLRRATESGAVAASHSRLSIRLADVARLADRNISVPGAHLDMLCTSPGMSEIIACLGCEDNMLLDDARGELSLTVNTLISETSYKTFGSYTVYKDARIRVYYDDYNPPALVPALTSSSHREASHGLRPAGMSNNRAITDEVIGFLGSNRSSIYSNDAVELGPMVNRLQGGDNYVGIFQKLILYLQQSKLGYSTQGSSVRSANSYDAVGLDGASRLDMLDNVGSNDLVINTTLFNDDQARLLVASMSTYPVQVVVHDGSSDAVNMYGAVHMDSFKGVLVDECAGRYRNIVNGALIRQPDRMWTDIVMIASMLEGGLDDLGTAFRTLEGVVPLAYINREVSWNGRDLHLQSCTPYGVSSVMMAVRTPRTRITGNTDAMSCTKSILADILFGHAWYNCLVYELENIGLKNPEYWPTKEQLTGTRRLEGVYNMMNWNAHDKRNGIQQRASVYMRNGEIALMGHYFGLEIKRLADGTEETLPTNVFQPILSFPLGKYEGNNTTDYVGKVFNPSRQYIRGGAKAGIYEANVTRRIMTMISSRVTSYDKCSGLYFVGKKELVKSHDTSFKADMYVSQVTFSFNGEARKSEDAGMRAKFGYHPVTWNAVADSGAVRLTRNALLIVGGEPRMATAEEAKELVDKYGHDVVLNSTLIQEMQRLEKQERKELPLSLAPRTGTVVYEGKTVSDGRLSGSSAKFPDSDPKTSRPVFKPLKVVTRDAKRTMGSFTKGKPTHGSTFVGDKDAWHNKMYPETNTTSPAGNIFTSATTKNVVSTTKVVRDQVESMIEEHGYKYLDCGQFMGQDGNACAVLCLQAIMSSMGMDRASGADLREALNTQAGEMVHADALVGVARSAGINLAIATMRNGAPEMVILPDPGDMENFAMILHTGHHYVALANPGVVSSHKVVDVRTLMDGL